MIRAAVALARRYSHINWALADQALVSGTNFATGILLARYLGLEEFGRFTLVWMVVTFASSVQFSLIIAPMMSIGPKQQTEDEPAYYGAVLVQQVGFSVLSGTLLFAGAKLSGHVFPEWRLENLALPLALAAIAFQLQDYLRRRAFIRNRGGTAFASDAVRCGGQLALLIGLFSVTTLDSRSVLWIVAAAAGVSAALALFTELTRITWNSSQFKSCAKAQWASGKWMFGSGLLQWISGNVFILGTGGILGTTAVGGLRAALNLIGIAHILFLGLENVMPVRAARHYRNGGASALRRYLTRVGMAGGLVTAALCGAAIVAPEFWLDLAFGAAYSDFEHVLRWMAVFYFLTFLTLPLRAGLRAVEYTKPFFSTSLISAGFAVIAVYPAAVLFGLDGIGAGMVVSSLITVFFLLHAFTAKIPIASRDDRKDGKPCRNSSLDFGG